MKIIKYLYPQIMSDMDGSSVVEVDKSADVNQDETSTNDHNTSATCNDFSTFCARCRKSIYETHHDVTLSPMKTNFIRGKNGYKKGVHLWSFRRVKGHHKTNAAIGVAAENAPTRKVGLRKPMMGNDEYSWMWDLDRNKLYHNNRKTYAFQFPERSGGAYRFDNEVWMMLDMDRGTLSFGDKNGHLGVAFHDLNTRGNLYPVLTHISGTCHMSMNYIGTLSNGALFTYLISNARNVRGFRDDNSSTLSNNNANDHPKTFLSWILWKYFWPSER